MNGEVKTVLTRPRVSVVIPIYNHARYIEAALMSVLKQTYRPIEIICIDDGSTDESGEVASVIASNLAGDITVIRRKNRGAHNTINQGVSLSSGKYITILNSDDYYHPERISECVSRSERYCKQFVFTDVQFVDDDDREVVADDYTRSLEAMIGGIKNRPTIGFSLLSNQVAITTGNFFFSRRLWNDVGAFRGYKYVHDWDFILRSLYFYEPSFINQKLYSYRLHRFNSYKSLAGIQAYETTEVMCNFMRSMVNRIPLNPLAPCPHYWPGYFQCWVEENNYQAYLPRQA